MNAGFRDIAAGAFESGLAQLDADPEWHDDRRDLEGPFRLGFPSAQGWGEELLVASLLKRHADARTAVPVFASKQVCSILQHDLAFRTPLCKDHKMGRPPLAILRQALMGELLDKPFVPLASPGAAVPSKIDQRPRVGIAWASVSGSHPILEKSVPVCRFLDELTGIDAELVSLQRKLSDADPHGLARNRGMYFIDDEVLDASTPSAVEALIKSIRRLDFLVTISTTTTHIAAALGIRVELIVAEREGQQWFWQVQARHGKCIYPTVRVHLGDGRKKEWWERSFQSLRAALSREEHASDGR